MGTIVENVRLVLCGSSGLNESALETDRLSACVERVAECAVQAFQISVESREWEVVGGATKEIDPQKYTFDEVQGFAKPFCPGAKRLLSLGFPFEAMPPSSSREALRMMEQKGGDLEGLLQSAVAQSFADWELTSGLLDDLCEHLPPSVIVSVLHKFFLQMKGGVSRAFFAVFNRTFKAEIDETANLKEACEAFFSDFSDKHQIDRRRFVELVFCRPDENRGPFFFEFIRKNLYEFAPFAQQVLREYPKSGWGKKEEILLEYCHWIDQKSSHALCLEIARGSDPEMRALAEKILMLSNRKTFSWELAYEVGIAYPRFPFLQITHFPYAATKDLGDFFPDGELCRNDTVVYGVRCESKKRALFAMGARDGSTLWGVKIEKMPMRAIPVKTGVLFLYGNSDMVEHFSIDHGATTCYKFPEMMFEGSPIHFTPCGGFCFIHHTYDQSVRIYALSSHEVKLKHNVKVKEGEMVGQGDKVYIQEKQSASKQEVNLHGFKAFCL